MKYSLTECQQKLLRSLVPGLKDGSVSTEWILFPGDEGINDIHGLDSSLWLNTWSIVKLADLKVFVKHGFFIPTRTDRSGMDVEYSLDAGQIITAAENDFEILDKDPRIVIKAVDSIVNVQSALINVKQTLSSNQAVDPQLTVQLSGLIDRLEKALQGVPPEQSEEAEAIVVGTQTIVEQLGSSKPNRRIIEINLDGLRKAAADVITVSELAIIANQIAHLIQTLIAK